MSHRVDEYEMKEASFYSSDRIDEYGMKEVSYYSSDRVDEYEMNKLEYYEDDRLYEEPANPQVGEQKHNIPDTQYEYFRKAEQITFADYLIPTNEVGDHLIDHGTLVMEDYSIPNGEHKMADYLISTCEAGDYIIKDDSAEMEDYLIHVETALDYEIEVQETEYPNYLHEVDLLEFCDSNVESPQQRIILGLSNLTHLFDLKKHESFSKRMMAMTILVYKYRCHALNKVR